MRPAAPLIAMRIGFMRERRIFLPDRVLATRFDRPVTTAGTATAASNNSTATTQLYSWMALTISSSSFETATARLANAARLTPREPSTLLNMS